MRPDAPCGPSSRTYVRTPLRCHEPRGAMSCGSPMPRGEQIAKPTERGIRLSVFFLSRDVMRTSMLLFLPLAVVGACRPPQQSLTEADRSAVAETVKRIVTGVFAAASRRDAAGL